MKRFLGYLILAACLLGCSEEQSSDEESLSGSENSSQTGTDQTGTEQSGHGSGGDNPGNHNQEPSGGQNKVCSQGCRADEDCIDGVCTPICENSTYCQNACIVLSEQHLSSCDQCAENWCDANNNLLDGCEINAKGNDPKNCGSCGHSCESGICENGTCVTSQTARRMMVLTDDLQVRTGPGTSNPSIGAVNQYDYITVTDEQNGWFRHVFEGQEGWSSGSYLLDICEECEGQQAIDYAEQFLYDSGSKMCTYDHLTHAPIIENFTDLSTYGATYDYGYDSNCANFATACLKTVGLISKNIINVQGVITHCQNRTDGWHPIDFKDAKAGDIWVNSIEKHVELVVGYKNDKVYLIGSNNFKDADGVNNCQKSVSGATGSDYQRVSYDSAKESGTSMVCTQRQD